MSRVATAIALLIVVIGGTAARRASAHPDTVAATRPATTAPTTALTTAPQTTPKAAPRQPTKRAATRRSARPVRPALRERRAVLNVGGQARTVLIDEPRAAAHARRAAVIVLHGLNGTPQPLRQLLGYAGPAARAGVVVAYPYGLADSWNAGTCCGRAAGRVNDIAFLDAIRSELVRHAHVDPHRIALVGFSNGGMLALQYACKSPGSIRAVVAISATLTGECPALPGRHPAVLLIRGARDTRVPAAGGRSAYLNADLQNADRSASAAAGGRCRLMARHGNRAGDVITDLRCALGTTSIVVVAGADHMVITPRPGHVNPRTYSWQFLTRVLHR